MLEVLQLAARINLLEIDGLFNCGILGNFEHAKQVVSPLNFVRPACKANSNPFPLLLGSQLFECLQSGREELDVFVGHRHFIQLVKFWSPDSIIKIKHYEFWEVALCRFLFRVCFAAHLALFFQTFPCSRSFKICSAGWSLAAGIHTIFRVRLLQPRETVKVEPVLVQQAHPAHTGIGMGEFLGPVLEPCTPEERENAARSGMEGAWE
mmetsp:Transcript_20797/g.51019  ORF Transcript_20797/g.51019 Transcript_20797/m.51019 type:complete len:208 (+) Transcript_20797:405-1028(+)